MAWGLTDEDRKWCQEMIRSKRSEGIFTPPSVNGSIIFPGNIGGMAWGGAAFDPEHGLLIIPTNRLAAYIRLIPRDQFDAQEGKEPGVEYARMRGTPYGLARLLRTPRLEPAVYSVPEEIDELVVREKLQAEQLMIDSRAD